MGPLAPLGSGPPESQPINRQVWVMPRDASSGALGFVEGEASRDGNTLLGVLGRVLSTGQDTSEITHQSVIFISSVGLGRGTKERE